MTTSRSRRGVLTGATLGMAVCLAGAVASPTASAASVSESSIVPDPSWTCGMSAAIPPPPRDAEPVLRITLDVGTVHDAGTTQYGRRRVLDVTGGTIQGARAQGAVLTGGMDLELTLANGSVELEQVNMLRMGDGSLVHLRTCGVAPAGEETVRIVPDFEAPTSSAHAWLNSGQFVGTRVVDADAQTVELAVYDISRSVPPAAAVRLSDPAGVPNQSWDCATGTGRRGASVFSESVDLGPAQTVGDSKRGMRNVIPLTGGTMTGRLRGTVVPGGSDFQITNGGTTRLDARYALSTTDGEYVLVRNCGPWGALIPTFETRADGPYAFLNTGKFLSSDPAVTGNSVNITFYERT